MLHVTCTIKWFRGLWSFRGPQWSTWSNQNGGEKSFLFGTYSAKPRPFANNSGYYVFGVARIRSEITYGLGRVIKIRSVDKVWRNKHQNGVECSISTENCEQRIACYSVRSRWKGSAVMLKAVRRKFVDCRVVAPEKWRPLSRHKNFSSACSILAPPPRCVWAH